MVKVYKGIFKLNYDIRKAIKREGRIIGWRCFTKNGLLFSNHFVGYMWAKVK